MKKNRDFVLCLLLPAALLTLPVAGLADGIAYRLVNAAIERTNHDIRYDGRYFIITYPNGDVPDDVGVCTDLVVRSYRKLGIDLQRLVHEDMRDHFDQYPSRRIWGLHRPDRNIDHRRVPNLQAFFVRNGETLPITQRPGGYEPGDLVTWMLPGHLPHIGIVTDRLDGAFGAPLIVHNIGYGPELEDILFKYRITGHYRYLPD